MNESIFESIQKCAGSLNVDLSSAEIALFAQNNELTQDQLAAVQDLFSYLAKKKRETIIDTLRKLSRLPVNNPKTFDNYDFSHLRGNQVDRLRSLNTLAPLYGHQNLAFIGPPGVGKTHLAMAFGYECCQRGMKTYFLKASELNQKFTEARIRGREGSVVNGLIKPSCLIIDEIGRCVFDKENTALFFDVIDRRYSKEGPSSIIFTSNKTPSHWTEYFSDNDDLLCALDRAFDDAIVYMFKGSSYRGKKCEKIAIEAGISKSLTENY